MNNDELIFVCSLRQPPNSEKVMRQTNLSLALNLKISSVSRSLKEIESKIR